MQRKVAVQLLALVVAIGCGREADSGRGSTRHAGNTTVAAQPLLVTGETDISEEYVYDGGGNLVETRSTATAALVAITDFSPHAGGAGQVVVVDGTGFSALPSRNTVTLNGQAVSVAAASTHQLSFVVPQGASTGRISVTTGGQTAASATDFTVLEGVVVTDFEPKLGKAGTAVTVTGANFDPDPVGDQVKIGDGTAAVSSASDTTLAVTVGPSASSGKVSVNARGLTGTSDADFYVVPGALSEAAIEFTGRLTIGVTVRVTIGTPGNAGLLLFDGTQGQYLTFYAGAVTFPGSTVVTVYAPNGSTIFTGTLTAGQDAKLVLPALPVTGTYTVSVQPEVTRTGSVDLQLLAEAAAVLDVRSGPVSLSLVRGQNGRCTFTGNAADALALGYTPFTTTPAGTSVVFTVHRPDGVQLGTSSATAAGSWQLSALPAGGTYVMTVRPAGTAAASIGLLLSEPVTGKIEPNGAAVQFTTSRAGQSARYTFDGVAGDRLALGYTTLAVTPTGGLVTFAVLKPDGTSLSSTTASAPGSWQIPLLPTTGTYTLTVKPPGTAALSTTVLLSRPITGTLATDGTPTRFESARAGQTGRYTFTATAGQSYTLKATASAGYSGSVPVTVYQPSGASIASGNITVNGSIKVDLGNLPATGTYTVVLTPSGTGTGTVDLSLLSQAIDTLVIGDPARTLTLATAQNGRYTFDGVAGDLLALGYTTLALIPTGGSVGFLVLKPDGTSLSSASPSAPGSWQIAQLPTTGTYTFTVKPPGTAALSTAVLLSRPITGTLTTDGTPTRFESARAGQTGQYTFTAAAGQSYTLKATASSGYSGSVPVTVYQPSGASIASGNIPVNGSTKVDLSVLPATGTYTVVLVPPGTGTGAVDLWVIPQATDTLAIGDPAKTLTLATAQNGRYTFDGVAGDLLALGYTTLALTPTGGSVGFVVLKPDGTSLASTSASAPGSWQIAQLPTTGTYTFTVKPPGTATLSTTVLLSRPITGTLATDGTPTRFESARAGQTGRYTFTAAAGQSYTLKATASSGYSGSVPATVYQPSGASIASGNITVNGSIKVDLGLLPATGTYTVVLTPPGAGTGTVDLSLLSQAIDTLVIGDPARTLTLATAQNGRYAFEGVAGDLLALGYPTLALTPTGGSVGFAVLKPDGTSLSSTTASGPGNWQIPQLPTTGTYTLTVKPPGTAALSTAVLLSRPITGTLTTDGTPTRFESARAGQMGRYTFTATAGQSFTLKATASAGYSGSVPITVYQPSGASIASGNITVNGSIKVDLGLLPATGAYTVVLVPPGSGTGAVDLSVIPQATDTLAIGDPARTLTLATAQNGRYAFDAASGTLLSLTLLPLSTTPANTSVSIKVLRPDGTSLWSTGTTSAGTWSLPQTSSTGTHVLLLQPAGTASLTTQAQLSTR